MSPLPLPQILPLLLSFVVFTGVCEGRLILPQLGAREWSLHDAAFKSRLAPLHSALSSDAITPSEAAGEFSAQFADFLGSIDVFKGGEGGGGREGGGTDISDEAFVRAKLEKKRLKHLVERVYILNLI